MNENSHLLYHEKKAERMYGKTTITKKGISFREKETLSSLPPLTMSSSFSLSAVGLAVLSAAVALVSAPPPPLAPFSLAELSDPAEAPGAVAGAFPFCSRMNFE